jgi:hypothetical protein
MKVANAEHARRQWLIAEIAPDFRLLDAWDLPVEGAADEFDDLLEVLSRLDPVAVESRPARALFKLRIWMGEVFGWDSPAGRQPIPGRAETSLAVRVPERLGGSAVGFKIASVARVVAFTPLYRTADEAAAEISNDTVHGVLHFSWIDQGDGRHRGRMAVYVKTRGLLGAAYVAAIAPFRHLVVYPALLRQVGRAWRARAAATASS